ncbi:nitrous oxide-stimulated promoter family protein [Arcobacter arenosus]|jgi:hypothetical protein|uniref:Nitrous oxide-regulated protein n=1 Tax=Arcobacter arenosus TaxID=2576037 RepID=A0A5R8Y266_9BACT|nr:nitrous oxide-stimulated promoter family protein [Arcobacter arenosus]TLP39343.1 hypothetical protein FDK22_05590 [Arcobacter arenosus]
MTEEKFQSEVDTLNRFFTKYCKDKHTNQKNNLYKFKYKNLSFETSISLCEECNTLISYSFDRLKECPHEIKPRCRNCENPCYEKTQWKSLSKVMRYSAIRLNLTNRIKKIFS